MDINIRKEKLRKYSNKNLWFIVSYLSLIFGFSSLASSRYNVYEAFFVAGEGVGIFLLFVFAITYLWAIYKMWKAEIREESKAWKRIHRVDFLFIILTAIVLFIFEISVYNNNIPSLSLIFLFNFLLSITFFKTLFYRIKTKTLLDTIYILKFYKYYPVYRTVGFITSGLIAVNILFILLMSGQLEYFFGIFFCSLIAFVIMIILMVLLYQYAKIKDHGQKILNGQEYESIDEKKVLKPLRPLLRVINTLSGAYDKSLTEHKISEQAKQELLKDYQIAMEEKLKSERLKIELITNVSHDIKTPLTSIINYVDLIKKLKIDNKDLNEYIRVIDKKSMRLKSLIEDLMEASKAGTGNVPVLLESIDLAELSGQIAGETEEKYQNAELVYISRIPNEKIIVVADGKHLWRIMENIYGNAAKYSMPGTRVYSDVKLSEGKAVFSLKNVSKEPLTISPDELTHQFVRGDKSRHADGNGLGLYIAKSLAELIGGRLDINVYGDLFEAVVVLNLLEEQL